MDASNYSLFRETLSKVTKANWAPQRKEKLQITGRADCDFGELTCGPDDEMFFFEGMLTPDTAVLVAALLTCDPSTYNKAKALLGK